jgi:pentatricopeptide repeat protein
MASFAASSSSFTRLPCSSSCSSSSSSSTFRCRNVRVLDARKAALFCATTSTALESQDTIAPAEDASLAPEEEEEEEEEDPYLQLPPHLAHLSPLVSAVLSSDGADVASSLEPWLHTLSVSDWNALVSRLGVADWNLSWKLIQIFKERVSVSSLVRAAKQRNDESSSVLGGEESPGTAAEQNDLETFPEKALKSTALVEDQTLKGSQSEPYLESESESESPPDPVYDKDSLNRRLERTLIKSLLTSKKFEEANELVSLIKETGVKLNARLYYMLLDAYANSGRMIDAERLLHEMQEEGIEPQQFIYEKVSYIFVAFSLCVFITVCMHVSP